MSLKSLSFSNYVFINVANLLSNVLIQNYSLIFPPLKKQKQTQKPQIIGLLLVNY